MKRSTGRKIEEEVSSEEGRSGAKEAELTGCGDGFVGDNVVKGDWTVLFDPVN